MRRSTRWCVCLTLLAAASPPADAAIAVVRATRSDLAKAVVRLRQYDRNAGRPAEVGGKAGDMTSLTQTDADVNYTYGYTSDVVSDAERPFDPTRNYAKITINAFHINGRMITTVFMPYDATPAMKAHEQAHADINAYAYNKLAGRATTFSRGMLRMTFEGRTLEEAQGKLNDHFLSNFRTPYDRWRDDLHKALNQIDGNGGNPNVSPEQAYRQVIAENGG